MRKYDLEENYMVVYIKYSGKESRVKNSNKSFGELNPTLFHVTLNSLCVKTLHVTKDPKNLNTEHTAFSLIAD